MTRARVYELREPSISYGVNFTDEDGDLRPQNEAGKTHFRLPMGDSTGGGVWDKVVQAIRFFNWRICHGTGKYR